MANTIPNKETIRRICILHGCSYCFIHVNTGAEHTDILTDIIDKKKLACLKELEAWCGMKFKLYNELSPDETIKQISTSGEKILPIKLT